MRAASLTLAFALLAPAAAAAPVLDFALPAQAFGTLSGDGLQWALLLFKAGEGRFHAGFPGGAQHVNHTLLRVGAQAHNSSAAPDAFLPNSSRSLGPLAADFGPGAGWASLLVVAERIQVEARANATLAVAEAGSIPSSHLGSNAYPYTIRRSSQEVLGRHAALGLSPRDGPLQVSLRAVGVRTLEWHNATVACASAGFCPDGAGMADAARGAGVAVQRYFYGELAGAGGTLDGDGTAWLAAIGGPEVTLGVQGAVRLPLARLQEACDGCPDPAGGTLLASGNLTLEGLAPDRDRLRARVAGLQAFRVDERPFTLPVAAVAATTGALAVVGALLARAVAALGRVKAEEALENPRRLALYHRILERPGLSLRELQRQAGLGIGTTVHHLRVLVRARHVVAQPYGHTVRYFENHGRYAHTWRAVAVLADPRLGTLHAWLLGHPGASQREVVQHARVAWGWGRSATQDRLGALLREGLAGARTVGRRTVYTARPPPAEPRPVSPTSNPGFAATQA